MSKLEELHLNAITEAEFDVEDKHPNYVGFAEKTSKLTTELLSKYLNFVEDEYYYYSGQWYKKGEDEYSEKTEILKQFIKTL